MGRQSDQTVDHKQQTQLIHQLVKAIDESPANYHHYYNLVVALTESQAYDQAEDLAQKSLTRFADNAAAQDVLKYSLGNVYYQTGHYELATKQYQQITTGKIKTDAFVMLAQTMMAQHDYQHALVYAITAHDQQKQDASITLLMADILLALGNNEQASDYYLAVLKKEPENGRASFGAGLTAMVLGKSYADFFAVAKRSDPKYYKHHHEQLVAAEQLTKKKSSGLSQN